MKFIYVALMVLPQLVSAHECDKFLDSEWASDEGYACIVSAEDLAKLRYHRMELCIGSVPYLDNRRYAHAEYKWVPLSQYNNPYSKRDGTNNKFFEKTYTGLSFEGVSGERVFERSPSTLLLKTFREGSSATHDVDFRADVSFDIHTGKGQLNSYYRQPALIFKNKWEKNFEVSILCQKIR